MLNVLSEGNAIRTSCCVSISALDSTTSTTLHVSCTLFCRQKIISDDPELWKGAYLKEKHYIAEELRHYFNSDVEAPNFSQPTDNCSLGENRKRAACWKQAAVALLTWRRFDSGPITSQAVKACPDRYHSPRLQFSMPPFPASM